MILIINLFLTPNPDQSPKDNSFIQITYQDLYDNVILKCLKNPNLSLDGRELIEQYANNLKEPIDDQPMALAHKDLCEEIYKRNRDILEEVFNDVDKDHKELHIRRAYDGETLSIYKTSFSIAASQAVYAYRLRQKENGEDVDAFPPSINGNAYWRYNGSNTAYKGKTVNEILKSI